MALLPRLRAIVRKTARGQGYTSELIENTLRTFLDDMTCVVTTNYLLMQSDEALEALYWTWERTAIKYPEFQSRLKQIMVNSRIYLAMPKEEPTQQEENNIVNLFTTH